MSAGTFGAERTIDSLTRRLLTIRAVQSTRRRGDTTMRFIAPRNIEELGEWSELAGPFRTMQAAEDWIDNPPELACGERAGNPIGTVTLKQKSVGGNPGWYVMHLDRDAETIERKRRAAEEALRSLAPTV